MRYSLSHDYEALFTPIAILEEPVSTNKGEQSRELTEVKRTLCPEYQEINDHILRDVLERVELAFKAFFKRNKEGVGYPKPKGKKWYNSFSSDSGFKFISRENPKRATFRLQNVGDIKIQLHRPLEGEVKRYIVIKEIDQWYVCFSCEIPGAQKLPLSYEDVGIDVGVAHFAALSDGSFIENPRYYRHAEENLARLQQSLSRKKKRGA
jgi:putative transposase